MEGFDLKQFLDGQRSDGVTDSEGAFTVAKEKALTKLALFALPDDYDWVLKVVQAVNAWHCPILKIRQTRVATSFFFCPPPENFPTEEVVVSALTSGILDNSKPVHQLCMALRSLVDQVGLSFVLAIRHNHSQGKPVFAGDDVRNLDSETREKWTTMVQDGVRLTVSHFKGEESGTGRYTPTFTQVERRDVKISSILTQRCFGSHTPIVLDGLPLTHLPACSEVGASALFRPLVLARVEEEQVSSHVFSYRQHHRFEKADFFNDPASRACRLYLQVAEWSSLQDFVDFDNKLSQFFLPMNSRQNVGSHKAFLTRHGVIVALFETYNWSHGVKACLFLSGDNIRSDLTGLKVEVDDDLKAMIEKDFQRAGQVVAELQGDWLTETSKAPAEVAVELEEPTGSLKAGYSILTESIELTGLLSKFRRAYQAVERSLRRRKVDQESMMVHWRVFLDGDLTRAAGNLEDPRLHQRTMRR